MSTSATSPSANTLPSSTRPVRPELASLLRSLKPGQRIRVTLESAGPEN